MSWLDDEANTNKAKETAEANSQEVLRRSNWWSTIVDSLRAEIAAINSHEYWKAKLAGFPLRMEQPWGSDGWMVAKSGFPAVAVQIEQKYDHVMIGRDFMENPLSREFRSREKLRLATMGESVVLVNDKEEALVVPAAVVQYILKPIIESLKITKS